MGKYGCIFQIFLGIILLFFLERNVIAQDILIRSSDKIGYKTEKGEPIKVLINNVDIVTESLQLRADTVYHYQTKKQLTGHGNVEVISSLDYIWSDWLDYRTEPRLAYFKGRVILIRDDNIAYASQGYAKLGEHELFLSDTVRIHTVKDQFLYGHQASFIENPDRIFFNGEVIYHDSTYTVYSDSLFIDKEKEEYIWTGDVFGHNNKENLYSQSNRMYIDPDRIIFTGMALVIQERFPSCDTVFLRGDEVGLLYPGTDSTLLYSSNNAELWIKDIFLKADSLWHYEKEERMEIIGHVYLWKDSLQLSGNQMDITMPRGEVSRIDVSLSPFLMIKDSVNFFFHQLKSEKISLFFEKENLKTIHAYGQAKLVTFIPYNKERGVLSAEAREIILYIENNKISEVKLYHSVHGNMDSRIQALDTQIDGAEWHVELRKSKPQRPDFKIPSRTFFNPPFAFPHRYRSYTDTLSGKE